MDRIRKKKIDRQVVKGEGDWKTSREGSLIFIDRERIERAKVG